MRKIADIFSTVVILASLAVLVTWLMADLDEEITGKVFVIDGDTVIINEEKIRFEGIDAPELGQTCKAKAIEYRCGIKSREHLRGLAKNGQMRCTAWQRDKYGRLLGQCFIGDIDVNARMVLDGWAVAFGDFYREEGRAQQQSAGLWAGEFEAPREWRHRNGSAAKTSPASSGDAWWKFWRNQRE